MIFETEEMVLEPSGAREKVVAYNGTAPTCNVTLHWVVFWFPDPQPPKRFCMKARPVALQTEKTKERNKVRNIVRKTTLLNLELFV